MKQGMTVRFFALGCLILLILTCSHVRPAGALIPSHTPPLEIMLEKVEAAGLVGQKEWLRFVWQDVLHLDLNLLRDWQRICNAIPAGFMEQERQFFPQPGQKRLFSKINPDFVYVVNRVRVSNEQELLAAMGLDPASPAFKPGQQALLTLFRTLHSKQISNLRSYTYRPQLKVLLCDLSMFEDYPDGLKETYRGITYREIILHDFWPCAGDIMQFGSMFFRGLSDDIVARVMVHEHAHTMDKMVPSLYSPLAFFIGRLQTEHLRSLMLEGRGNYGKDQTHYLNEVLLPAAAHAEGWAVFNELINPIVARASGKSGSAFLGIQLGAEETRNREEEVRKCLSVLLFEKPNSAIGRRLEENYDQVPWEDPRVNGQTALCVEGVQALIMSRMARQLAQGWRAVFEAFKTVNRSRRQFRDVIRAYLNAHPQQTLAVMKIIDEETHRKMTVNDLVDFYGITPITYAALHELRPGEANQIHPPVTPAPTPLPPSSTPTGSVASPTSPMPGTPSAPTPTPTPTASGTPTATGSANATAAATLPLTPTPPSPPEPTPTPTPVHDQHSSEQTDLGTVLDIGLDE
ncbi:MAG: Proline-rich protein [Candidatus Ozemobacter sibiricus]|jgi:hypothetical protein|uniref:Proline-rich protein n=1 Tax=Candidatus Ozemobacter sibiricus TaxID=2268124 RepID=A0A367ZTU6_9BACT|nr:MAG: Proline-rich protein [Candidatus Ozemobacter sibiricus]